MSISTSHGVVADNPGHPDGHPGPRVAKDVARCEALLSRAAETGTAIEQTDVDSVRDARSALDRKKWGRAIDGAFYPAMSRIAAAVQYPARKTAEDIGHCSDMVSYAAQNGKTLEAGDVEALSKARDAQQNHSWNPEIEGAFYAAMSRISHTVAPVVAETAGDDARQGARRAIRIYTRSAIALTILVVSLSCLLFVVNQISADISVVVKNNDAAALSLHNQLQAHAVEITEAKGKGSEAVVALQNSQPALQIKKELQQFATNNRQLFADVMRINALTRSVGLEEVRSPYKPPCPKKAPTGFPITYANAQPVTPSDDWQCNPAVARELLEVTLPLLANPRPAANDTRPPAPPENAVEQGFQKIAVYQDIRAMAIYVNDIILSFVGAVTGFLLPVLYAWLGACAAILRQLSADSSANVFHPEHSKVANRAHVTSAVIVGISIGLFSELLQGGKEVSPLAIAFVAGYASDKFFIFVDRLVGAIFPGRATERPDAGKSGASGASHAPPPRPLPPNTASADATGAAASKGAA